jgi:hypothetical protein
VRIRRRDILMMSGPLQPDRADSDANLSRSSGSRLGRRRVSRIYKLHDTRRFLIDECGEPIATSPSTRFHSMTLVSFFGLFLVVPEYSVPGPCTGPLETSTFL